MTVLVTGATGTVGAGVVRALTARGVPTRAYVRDHTDPSNLRRAMDGVDAVFLACGNVAGQVDFECSVIDGAADAGVPRLVKLSGPDADTSSPLLYFRWHGEIERHLAASGVPSVVLRPATYMSNLLAYADAVRFTGKVFAPAGAARIAFVDPRDVADIAAIALIESEHDGRVYTLTGPEAITFGRIADELSVATGQQIDYVDVPDEAARASLCEAGVPGPMVDFIVGVFAEQRGGSMSATTDTIPSLLGRPARSITQFARDHRLAFTPVSATRTSTSQSHS